MHAAGTFDDEAAVGMGNDDPDVSTRLLLDESDEMP